VNTAENVGYLKKKQTLLQEGKTYTGTNHKEKNNETAIKNITFFLKTYRTLMRTSL
jgi:hypothetical protein